MLVAGANLLMAVSDHPGALRLAARLGAMPGGGERAAALQFGIQHHLGFYRESRATLARLDVARHRDLHERQLRVTLRVGDHESAAELLAPLRAAFPSDDELRRVAGDVADRRTRSPGTPRDDSRVILDTIRTADPDALLARIAAVQERYPESGLPLAHHGEVLMWLGRYDEARASLERALAVSHRTRWPYYGLGVLRIIAGRPEEAIDLCARGYAAMGNSDAPFEHAVRGEALRALGRPDEAVAELGIAIAANSRRLSSHLNLGLLHAHAGRARELADTFRHVAEQAPALVVAAAADCGVDLWRMPPGLPPWPALDDDERARVLGAMLARVHGNRSASCLTWLGDAGVVRTIDGLLPGVASRHLREAVAILRRPAPAR